MTLRRTVVRLSRALRQRFAFPGSSSVLLALCTFGLFCAYIIATHRELNLLNNYLGENVIPGINAKTYWVTFGLAILFGALIALSRNLLAYSAVMVTYNLFDLWGNWQVAKTIGPPLERKLQIKQDKGLRRSLQTIRDFYFGNPTLPRIVTIMYMNWIVVCLALAYFLTDKDSLRTYGYVLLLANITIGELIIHRWRWRSISKLQ